MQDKLFMHDEEICALYNLEGTELVALWWSTYEEGKELYNDKSKWYWWHITHEGNRAATYAGIQFSEGKETGQHRTILVRSIVQAKHFISFAQYLGGNK